MSQIPSALSLAALNARIASGSAFGGFFLALLLECSAP